MSAEAVDDVPMLIVASLSEPEPMTRLKERTAEFSLPPSVPVVMGIVFVDAERRLSLGAPGLTRQMLVNLAQWVTANVGAHPDLAVLKDASLVELDAQGIVRARHHAPELWAAVPSPPRQSETDRSVRLLQKLAPHTQRCWFWATAAGLGGQPALVTRPLKSADSVDRFSALVRTMRRQCPPDAHTLQGSVLRTRNNALVFTISSDPTHAPAVFGALAAQDTALAALLNRAFLVQTGTDAPPIALLPAQAAADADTLALLDGLKADDALCFWFTDQDASDRPCLMVRRDMDTLRADARHQKGSGQSVRGTLSRHATGWCHFQATMDAPWFLAALFGWTSTVPHPTAAILRLARLSCRDTDGTLIARYRNDALWAPVPDTGG